MSWSACMEGWGGGRGGRGREGMWWGTLKIIRDFIIYLFIKNFNQKVCNDWVGCHDKALESAQIYFWFLVFILGEFNWFFDFWVIIEGGQQCALMLQKTMLDARMRVDESRSFRYAQKTIIPPTSLLTYDFHANPKQRSSIRDDIDAMMPGS